MIITASITELAYVRAPTLNLETMKCVTAQARINLFLKKLQYVINGRRRNVGFKENNRHVPK